MKRITSIVVIAVLLLATTVGGILLYSNNPNNLYEANVSKSYIADAAKLDLDNFDVVDSYCKRNNTNSSSKFKFYNEFLIAKLKAKNDDKNLIPGDFEKCEIDSDLLGNIDNCFQNYNVSWLKDINNSNCIWHKRVQQFEDNNIKSSVTLYFIENQKSNEYYIILDQSHI